MAWHARLSASTAERWMNCTGSVGLIDSLPERERGGGQSEFAALGTAAHHLGGWCLERGIETSYDLLSETILIVKGDAYWPENKPEGEIQYAFVIDGDMCEAVDVYLDTVAALRVEFPDEEELIEVQMDMSWLDERFGGTADYERVASLLGLLVVVDYKHGQGVVVEVKDNHQLRKYGVGALHDHPECDRVRIVIVQPRAPHPDGSVRSVEYSREELDLFAAKMLVAARETETEDATLKVGKWCKFCPAAAAMLDSRTMLCPEMQAEITRQAQVDFADDPEEIPVPNDLGRVLMWAPIFENWFTQCDALGQRALESGLDVEGFKLVRGRRGDRVFTGEEARTVAKILRLAKGLGLDLGRKDLYSTPKMKSPHQVEGLGKGMKAAVEDMCEHGHDGKITMAPVSDPRPAERPSAITDFEEENDAKD